MARLSSVDRLPPEVRDAIGRLREGGHTIDQILEKLAELDATTPSRSALGRYVKQIDAIGEQLRRSRIVADAMVAKLDDAGEEKTARLNIALCHGMLTKLMISDDGENVILDPKEASFLTAAIKNLTAAKKADADLTLRLRQEVAKEAAEAAAEVAREEGLSAELVQTIRTRGLGIQR